MQAVFAPRLRGGALFSFWTHFPHVDRDAGRLAEATVQLQRTFDLDLVKTSPNGMYAVEDFGLEFDFTEVPLGGVARVVSTPYHQPDDWARLPELDVEQGALGRELHSLRLLRRALPDVPIVFTVFSPITVASKLSRGRVHAQIREGGHGRHIHDALMRLADMSRRYMQAAIAAGADGIFLAHQDTGRHLLSYDQFSEFVVPYDIEALLGARGGRFNILHLHGPDIRFREVSDYPVHALNWHDWETRPSIGAGLLGSGKCALGGIDRAAITANDIPALEAQIRASLSAAADAGNLILAPSCTIRAGFDSGTLHAIRDIVRRLGATAA